MARVSATMRARPVQHALALGRETEEARCALHQHYAERLLELLDACGKGRLGHAALLGGPAEVLFPRQGDEEFELVDHWSVGARPVIGIIVEFS